MVGKEHRGVLHKQLGVLKLRPVIGVRVDDELRIRDVLLHDERVDRGPDQEGHAAGVPEAAIGEADSVGLTN